MTLIDYPGYLAAIIFTQGCNFRCRFCYNPILVLPLTNGSDSDIEKIKGQTREAEDGLFDFLKKRQGKLEGIVITGGEPTLHSDLPEFIAKIKRLGYLVKLDTNGSHPEMLKALIADKLIDYIAMDLKADWPNYQRTTGVALDFSKNAESVKIIKSSGLPHEFRTTCVPGFHNEKIIAAMAEYLRGADKWYLQKFKSDTALIEDGLRNQPAFTDEQMENFARIGSQAMGACYLR